MAKNQNEKFVKMVSHHDPSMYTAYGLRGLFEIPHPR